MRILLMLLVILLGIQGCEDKAGRSSNSAGQQKAPVVKLWDDTAWKTEYNEMILALGLDEEKAKPLKAAFDNRETEIGEWIKGEKGAKLISRLNVILSESIDYSLANREAAVGYALDWARDMGADLADKFVGMYVNDLTVDMGDIGRKAITEFLNRATEKGYIPESVDLEFAK